MEVPQALLLRIDKLVFLLLARMHYENAFAVFAHGFGICIIRAVPHARSAGELSARGTGIILALTFSALSARCAIMAARWVWNVAI